MDAVKQGKDWKERLGILGVGLVGNQLITLGFNWVLYPYVIWRFRLVEGFFIMATLSVLVCYLLILFYDWTKQDWLGIETIKEVKIYDGSSRVKRLTSWVINKSDPLALIVLSIKFDPFITTVYMRRDKFGGMSRRDWKIFFASLVIGDVWWSTSFFMGISLVEYLWPWR